MLSKIADENYEFSSFRLFPKQRALFCGDALVPIGGRGFDLLLALVSRAGSVISAKDLIGYAWPGVTVEHSNLRVQIASLRRALSCCEDGCRAIETVSVRGYCFTLPVLFHGLGSDRVDGPIATSYSAFDTEALPDLNQNGRAVSERSSLEIGERGSLVMGRANETLSNREALPSLGRLKESNALSQFEEAISEDTAALFAYLVERIAFEVSCKIDPANRDPIHQQNRRERLGSTIAKGASARSSQNGRLRHVI